ncbi:VOC family protein [Mesorhizobium sp. M0674]|uniref:VOC family protein n=1 Tax=Mesorhizobium sp. M0674 TaxID=2956983 RepID=UPI00333DFD70
MFSKVNQIGLVVHKLEPWLQRYCAMGIGPWWVKTYAAPELTDMRVRGKPAHYSMRLALAEVGAVQWELIEPLTGPSIYHEHLNQHGEGFHHVHVAFNGYCNGFLSEMVKRNSPPLMEGTFHGSRFTYFDTIGTLGVYVEATQTPSGFVRPAPDYIFPRDASPNALGAGAVRRGAEKW